MPHFAWSQRKTRAFIHERQDINALWCRVVAARNIFTSLLQRRCSAGVLFTKERLSADLHLEHAGSDTCNAGCAPAKG